MLMAHGATHTGVVRRHNEDTVLSDPALGLFIIADGMGGVNAGEVASRIAVDAVQAFIVQSAAAGWNDWPFGADNDLSVQGNRVRTAVKLANQAVYRAGQENIEYAGMGTTIAVVLIEGRTAAICGVGDTRVYVAGLEAIEQITTDHTWVETIRAQDPSIDPDVLARHPMRHVLTAVIGGQPDVEADVVERTFEPDERLLICSDGVYRGVVEDRLRLLARSGTVKSATRAIVDAALAVDGRDNISAVVISFE